MSGPSPTLEGFRAAFRRRSLTLGEIAWRWTMGSTAAALFVFYCVEYLDTLPVSTSDAMLLSTRQPMLVGRAIGHIVQGSLSRAVFAASLVALGLSVVWIIAASFGRLATVRALLDYFHEEFASSFPIVIAPESAAVDDIPEDNPARPRAMRTLIDINFLRVALVLSMALSIASAAILSSLVSTTKMPRPDLAVILFLLLVVAICLIVSSLNWWLSLAAIFAVRDREDALGSLSAAVAFFRERSGAVLAVSTWTGLAHLVAFSVALTAVSFPLAFIRIAPSRLVIAGMIVVALVYFAIADWIYMARLAGYVYIAELPESALAAESLPPESPGGSRGLDDAAIDRDERILSDAPAWP
jgi:hypothetical protein